MSVVETNASKLIELGKKYLDLGNFVTVALFGILTIALLLLWMYTEIKYEHTLRIISHIVEDKMITDKELALYSHYARKTFYQKWREKLE